eukprot:5605424-Pyramimonas_sp.AAC.1
MSVTEVDTHSCGTDYCMWLGTSPGEFALRVREECGGATLLQEQIRQNDFGSEWRGPICLKPSLDLIIAAIACAI